MPHAVPPETPPAETGREPEGGNSASEAVIGVDVAECCSFRTQGGRIVRPAGQPIDSYDALQVEGRDHVLRINFDPGPIGWETDAAGRRVTAGGFPALLAEDRSSGLAGYATNETLVVPLLRGERQAALTVRIACRADGCGVREQILATLRFAEGWRSNAALAPALHGGG